MQNTLHTYPREITKQFPTLLLRIVNPYIQNPSYVSSLIGERKESGADLVGNHIHRFSLGVLITISRSVLSLVLSFLLKGFCFPKRSFQEAQLLQLIIKFVRLFHMNDLVAVVTFLPNVVKY